MECAQQISNEERPNREIGTESEQKLGKLKCIHYFLLSSLLLRNKRISNKLFEEELYSW